MADLTDLAAAFDTACAELAAGDLDAHPRAVNAGLKLAAATQRAMATLDDDLYRAQRDKVAALDHNRR